MPKLVEKDDYYAVEDTTFEKVAALIGGLGMLGGATIKAVQGKKEKEKKEKLDAAKLIAELEQLPLDARERLANSDAFKLATLPYLEPDKDRRKLMEKGKLPLPEIKLPEPSPEDIAAREKAKFTTRTLPIQERLLGSQADLAETTAAKAGIDLETAKEMLRIFNDQGDYGKMLLSGQTPDQVTWTWLEKNQPQYFGEAVRLQRNVGPEVKARRLSEYTERAFQLLGNMGDALDVGTALASDDPKAIANLNPKLKTIAMRSLLQDAERMKLTREQMASQERDTIATMTFGLLKEFPATLQPENARELAKAIYWGRPYEDATGAQLMKGRALLEAKVTTDILTATQGAAAEQIRLLISGVQEGRLLNASSKSPGASVKNLQPYVDEMMKRIAEINGMDEKAFRKTGGGKYWEGVLAYGFGLPYGAVQAGTAFVQSAELDIPSLIKGETFAQTYQRAGGNPTALPALMPTSGVEQRDLTGAALPASPTPQAPPLSAKDSETALLKDAQAIEKMIQAAPSGPMKDQLLARLAILEAAAKNPNLLPAYLLLPPIGQ